MRNSRQSSVGNPRRGQAFPYVSGSAAPALEPNWREKTREKSRSTKIEYTPGGATRVQTKAAPLTLPIAIKMVAMAVLLFALVGFVNITFTSLALASSTQENAISEEVSKAREEGRSLEAELGSLSTPSSIKEKASDLGMAPATETIQVNLEEDIVKIDENGNLELAKSLKAAAGL